VIRIYESLASQSSEAVLLIEHLEPMLIGTLLPGSTIEDFRLSSGFSGRGMRCVGRGECFGEGRFA
jgi:hypothetical protein